MTATDRIPEPRRFAIPIPRSLWIGLGTVAVVIVAATIAGPREVKKVGLALAGPVLGVSIAWRVGRNSIVSTVMAAVMAGFFTLGSFGFYIALFPPPPDPGFVNWSDGSIAAATYLFFMAGLMGGFFGGIVGLLAGTTAWLFRQWNSSRS